MVLVALASMTLPAVWKTDFLWSSVLLVAGVIFGLVLPSRVLAIRRLRRPMQRLLVVGTSPLARRLVDILETQPEGRHEIAGVVGDAADAWGERKLRGPLASLDKIIDEVQPDRIVVALADWRRVPTLELLNARAHRGIPVQDVAEAYERLTGKLAIEALTPTHLLFSDGIRPSRLSLAVRRGFSFLVAGVGLLLIVPLLGLIAVAIKLDSPGPVLFAQRRTGLRGKSFTLYKFRTMHPTDRPPSEWVRDNEHRITRLGRWLRRFWLDELPQLFNILRGDMNLVGPRPHPSSNFELLTLVARNAPDCGLALPYYFLRCTVRPGLTGWAQVRTGYANDLDEEIEKLRYDLYYLKHQSFWFDLRIILATLRDMLGGQPSKHRPTPSDHRVWGPAERRA
ncbi:MAG TPA: exopolysaccharide biosynthesis polyprenyl glycosylphosphotransferase [bacterium]